MNQLNYIVKRLLQMIPVLFIVTIVIFLGIRMIPGNPAENILGDKASPESVAALEKKMGLDQPLWKQYLIYMDDIIHLDFGNSLRLKQPVSVLFKQKASASPADT